MQVENIARIGFASRRPPQQQRHLPISDGLFRKIVIGDERVHAVVAEIFPIVHPEKGARYCKGAGSDAVAATMIE